MSGEYQRPDPDALPQSPQEEEKNRGKRGRLRMFFGMAAGVGKTYAMLEAAVRMAREGVDIIIGYVETRGRGETEELLKGLEAVPRKTIDYRGMIIEEFDIDAVLKRRPVVVLVDELAHTNAEGSRHAKRYQDVTELLDNGIDVFSTLNVQHLESQADVVEKITGVKIRETVPDSILDLADEIELVDLPPEELLKRLAEGKVYIPEKAELAAERFFRKGNLTALREMSLRYVAGLVGYELRDYARKKRIRGPWKAGERLLVAVSPSPYSEYLIRWTRRMAFNLKAPWIALYIEKQKALSPAAQITLNKNLALARELGAEVISTADEDVVSGLLRVARRKNITQIVAGKPLRKYLSDYFSGGNLIDRLIRRSGDIEIHIVTRPEPGGTKPRLFGRFPGEPNLKEPLGEYLIAAAVIAGITVVNLFLAMVTGYWTIALVFLLSIVLLSLYVGKGPVLLGATLSSLSWNFLFIPPILTFRIARLEDALMFGMYFVIATVMGALTSKLRLKELALRAREERISGMYEFSRALSAAFGMDEVIGTAVSYIENSFQSKVTVFPADEAGASLGEPHKSDGLSVGDGERAVAEWAFRNKKPAGLFTDTLSGGNMHYIPLAAPGRMAGVMGLRPDSGIVFSMEQLGFLQNISYQLAVRLERERLSTMSRKAMVAEESERLYRILLNSITHELRTPLTAIKGLVSTMMDPSVGSDRSTRNSLLSETQEASERLIRLVDNLLDMSRIESGRLRLNLDWNDISDILGITMGRLGPHLEKHPLTVNCPDDIPLVRVDYNLVEQAIYCIIHNAMVHTEEGTPVSVSVSGAGDGVTITIEDEGKGLPEEDIQKLFDKFYRIERTQSQGGLGLGLSISRGIVELHGGSVRAENKATGGARFVIFLPVEMKEKAE